MLVTYPTNGEWESILHHASRSFNIFSDIKSDLRDDFRIVLTEDQEKGVRALLSGNDVVAAMPTGTGKSLMFQSVTYSAAKRCLRYITLIVTPLKAISFNHIQTFRNKVSDLNQRNHFLILTYINIRT